MVSIFRKIRRQSLKGSKFGEYLLYAIGEIILIVIGILIALGINNWNENRLIRKKEQFYLAGLKNDFEQSRIKLENLINVNRLNYENAKTIAEFINATDKPGEKEFSELLYQSFSYEIDYNPNSSLLNELINSGDLKNISNVTLRAHLTSWESFVQSIHRQEGALREQREKIVDIFRTDAGSIRTILDQADVSTKEMGLTKSRKYSSNLSLLNSTEFENKLLLFILTGKATEVNHYRPLMDEIGMILRLIEGEVEE